MSDLVALYILREETSEETSKTKIQALLTWTRSELQSHLIREGLYTPDCHALVFGDRYLEDDVSLSSYDIQENSNINVVQRFLWPSIKMETSETEGKRKNRKIDIKTINLMTERITVSVLVNNTYYNFLEVALYYSLQTLLDSCPKMKSYIPLRCRFFIKGNTEGQNEVEIESQSPLFSIVKDYGYVVRSTCLSIDLRLQQ